MSRTRQFIAWFCMAASLWMGTGLPLHGLSHAVRALEATSHPDPLPAQDVACDQCLLLAAADGALPSAVIFIAAGPTRTAAPIPRQAVGSFSSFTAYASRAPPTRA